jgi:tetratricopeptide (TPR) repeat protein
MILWNSRRVWRRIAAASALAVAVAVFPVAPVMAAEPEARQLYERGAQAYREARYEEAIALLLRAHQIAPYPELSYDLGRAYEGAGDLARAIASFREYLRLQPNAGDRAVVEARIQNLERRLTVSEPRISVSSSPAGATVAIDDRVVGTTPWNGSLGAGAHRITLLHAGYRSVTRELKLAERQQAELHLDLQPTAASPARAAPPAQDERGPKISLPVWIALGVGVGALGTAVGFELARRSAEDKAKDAETQLAHQERYQVAERNRDLARLFLGIGAAATLTSGVLLYLDFRTERSPGSAVGVVGTGRF